MVLSSLALPRGPHDKSCNLRLPEVLRTRDTGAMRTHLSTAPGISAEGQYEQLAFGESVEHHKHLKDSLPGIPEAVQFQVDLGTLKNLTVEQQHPAELRLAVLQK